MRDILFLEEEHPVCGWIVCVKGPRRGKDYRVMDGKNFVGRADDMDIQILGTTKSHLEKPCGDCIRRKETGEYDFAGDSNGLVYLNGEAVYLPQPLSAYDVIEMGESTFLLFLSAESIICGRTINECPIPDHLHPVRVIRNCILYRFCLVFQSSREGYETEQSKTIGSREIQMDYYTIEENENGLLAVLADGMGKEAGGRIAAKTVIRVLKEIFGTYNMADPPFLFFQKSISDCKPGNFKTDG